jgi:hypothetical protein
VFTTGVALSVALIVALEFADPSDQILDGALETLLANLYAKRLYYVCTLLIVQSACGCLVWAMGFLANKGPDCKKIKIVLNRLVESHFSMAYGANHVYRATLFRQRRCWLLGSWLGVVERSGEVYLDRSSIFSVNSQSRKYNTGIVGECWFRAQSNLGGSFSAMLDDVRDDESKVSEYKNQGFIDDIEFKQLSVKSQFFRVTEIRRHGKVWGVLVVDTTDASAQPSKTQTAARNKQEEALDNAANTISLLLE